MPALGDRMIVRPNRVPWRIFGQERGHGPNPATGLDVNLCRAIAAVDQQLLHVAVRKPVPQVPVHRQHDDLGREPETREGRAGTASADETGKTTSPAHPARIRRRSLNTSAPRQACAHRGWRGSRTCARGRRLLGAVWCRRSKADAAEDLSRSGPWRRLGRGPLEPLRPDDPDRSVVIRKRCGHGIAFRRRPFVHIDP